MHSQKTNSCALNLLIYLFIFNDLTSHIFHNVMASRQEVLKRPGLIQLPGLTFLMGMTITKVFKTV